MNLGILQFDLIIDASRSLKDKRRVVRSVKDRLRRRFNVSIAEIGSLETWNLATLGVVIVSNDAKFISAVLDKVTDHLRGLPDARLGEFMRQIVDAGAVADAYADTNAPPLWTEAERREPGEDPADRVLRSAPESGSGT